MPVKTATECIGPIKPLIAGVRDAFTPYRFPVQLGFKFLEPGEYGNDGEGWVIGAYPTKTRLVGGRDDGLNELAEYHLDIQKILDVFYSIRGVCWEVTDGSGSLDGPHIRVTGTLKFSDQEILVDFMFFDSPPEGHGSPTVWNEETQVVEIRS